MHDQWQPTRFAYRVEVVDTMLRLEAEAQPMVRRHDIERRGARLLRQVGVVDCFGDTFADDR